MEVGFEVIVAMILNTIFCDVTPCSPTGVMWHDEFD
jgi:hypothetical protein